MFLFFVVVFFKSRMNQLIDNSPKFLGSCLSLFVLLIAVVVVLRSFFFFFFGQPTPGIFLFASCF